MCTVPTFVNVSKEEFIANIYPKRFPAVLRGVDIGDCVHKWNKEYISEKVGNTNVKVHVSASSQLDFLKKNFTYETIQFGEFLDRASRVGVEPKEYYYLRSIGSDRRGREIADIQKQFPEIAGDINIPQYFSNDRFFSSVFRVGSPGVQLWTHYDVMDNILIQVKGRKRMVLFRPSDALNMYLVGDKSEVLDIDNPDVEKFPKFKLAERHECFLEAGDIMFIPALWFHNALALDFGIAVNVFWRHLEVDMYDKNDPYGNKDIVPAARALQMVGNALKALQPLPGEYRDFYTRRLISSLQSSLQRD
ncbi:tRNA wybutosine-synthesizing protein 5-like [Bacillus rossius redtenbacheri]|uniref:tRNA wybutosine-synthesizing protein 5-like n=1 Tax=Bacillus rossius redtenbacheri TaxID=93214 RepID=UPI002FDF03EC